ncbi:MAG: hypothetical protein HQM10_00875 [Candidatus Riflebacteria bacterium]|nr:hypothetical protein [Candidatus Riflebacteria bacterium]
MVSFFFDLYKDFLSNAELCSVKELLSNLPDDSRYVDAVFPRKTLPISITGSSCELNCAHCDGHYLKSMRPLSDANGDDCSKYSSFLISGGSSKTGAVPIDRFINSVAKKFPDSGLNFHIGFQGAQLLRQNKIFSGPRNCISFDLIGTSEILRDVFKVSLTPSDLERMYLELIEIARVVPHTIAGLMGDDLSGVFRTLNFLNNADQKKLTLLVFRPTAKTEMALCKPPALDVLYDFLNKAVNQYNFDITLGCMRPAGVYRRKLDLFAWLHGVRRIVNPDRLLLKAFEATGIKINSFYECCAFC